MLPFGASFSSQRGIAEHIWQSSKWLRNHRLQQLPSFLFLIHSAKHTKDCQFHLVIHWMASCIGELNHNYLLLLARFYNFRWWSFWSSMPTRRSTKLSFHCQVEPLVEGLGYTTLGDRWTYYWIVRWWHILIAFYAVLLPLTKFVMIYPFLHLVPHS